MGDSNNQQLFAFYAIDNKKRKPHQHRPAKNIIDRLSNSRMRLYQLHDTLHFRDKCLTKTRNLFFVKNGCRLELSTCLQMKLSLHSSSDPSHL